MKCAKIIDSKIEIVDVFKPVLTTNGAIIKVLGCGLCGSDIVKFKHSTKENEDKIVLGHEVVGIIEEINCKVKDFKVGDIVALAHHYPCLDKIKCEYCKNESYSMCPTFKSSNIFPAGFAQYIKVDENHLKYTVYKMNPDLKNDEKAFLEPLSCCLRAIRRAGFSYSEDNSKFSALVVGLGSIGYLMTKGLEAFRVDTYGFDVAPERAKKAKYDENKKYDVVFLTAGADKAIKTALDKVIDGGKIIVFSSVKDDLTSFSNNEIYYRELSIISSYSPSMDDIKLSAELLNNKIIDVSNLSTYYSLDNLSNAVNDIIEGNAFKAYIEL